jgi:hypothetical protein
MSNSNLNAKKHFSKRVNIRCQHTNTPQTEQQNEQDKQ